MNIETTQNLLVEYFCIWSILFQGFSRSLKKLVPCRTLQSETLSITFMLHFVKFCFSQHDEGFVKAEIIDYLEDLGFIICWHQRDFRPGSFITENIADATEHSRRMICVFSR